MTPGKRWKTRTKAERRAYASAFSIPAYINYQRDGKIQPPGKRARREREAERRQPAVFSGRWGMQVFSYGSAL